MPTAYLLPDTATEAEKKHARAAALADIRHRREQAAIMAAKAREAKKAAQQATLLDGFDLAFLGMLVAMLPIGALAIQMWPLAIGIASVVFILFALGAFRD